ncbi:hypothetical protein QBC39DRAFT_346966 [Podospora conica]|nr:hypothetical protein QBC39DRAFT_346966 [Schizothecium conicum]
MSSDQVKLARLRHDHNGRRIAVVEFHRRSDAEAFMDKYYPEVSFPLENSRGPDSEAMNFGVSFNRRDEPDAPRESTREGEDWECTNCGSVNYPHRAVCFRCKVDRPEDDGYGQDFAAFAGPILTGETDEDPQQVPSQYLVVRGLDRSVTEQVLSHGIMKLFVDKTAEPARESTTFKLKSTAPTTGTAGLGAQPGTLRRVFLMRDRRSNESWRYGFAEFATVDDARAALAKFRASSRFTIASKPVAVAFIHTGVFVPAPDADPAANPNFSFTPIYNRTLRLKYWDDRAYPSVLVVTSDPSLDAPSPEKSGANDEAGKARNALGAKKSKKDKEPAAVAMMPQMQMWAQKSAELHGIKKKKLADSTTGEQTDLLSIAPIQREDLEDLQPDGPLNPHKTDKYLSYADWDTLTCLLCNWQVPPLDAITEKGYSPYRREDLLIDHEVRVHNHYRDPSTTASAASKLSALGKTPRTIIRRQPRLRSAIPPVYLSYADLATRRCHLCRRSFKHTQTIWRHEQESELHRRLLADPANKARAAAELADKGKTPTTMIPDGKTTAQQNRYRDRAQERRRAFRQPTRPKAAGTGEKRKEPAETVEETPAAKKSKGAGMLAKMGWAGAGAGLGAEGTGRTEAIATEVYAPGVGLGAEGARLGDAAEEAARKTRGGFAGFVEKTRDRARERFERLEGGGAEERSR